MGNFVKVAEYLVAVSMVVFSTGFVPVQDMRTSFEEQTGVTPTIVAGPLKDNDEVFPADTDFSAVIAKMGRRDVLVCDADSSTTSHQGTTKNALGEDAADRTNVTYGLNRAFSCAEVAISNGIDPSRIYLTWANERVKADEISIRVYVIEKSRLPSTVIGWGQRESDRGEGTDLDDNDGDGVYGLADACPENWGAGEDGCPVPLPPAKRSKKARRECLDGIRVLAGAEIIGNPGQAGPAGSVKVILPVACHVYVYGEGALGYDMLDKDLYTSRDAECHGSCAEDAKDADDNDVMGSMGAGVGYKVSDSVALEAGVTGTTSYDTGLQSDAQTLMATAGACFYLGRYAHVEICAKLGAGVMKYPGGAGAETAAILGPVFSIRTEPRTEEERLEAAADRAARKEARELRRSSR